MKHDLGIGATPDLSLRVSVATLVRVVFRHPDSGEWMLALERKATVMNDGGNSACPSIGAQPYGGGVHILNPTPLQELIGEIKFYGEHSQSEQDFRILIPPSKWELVKQYCLHHLENPDDAELESLPHRELTEEFAETIDVDLKQDQYTVQPLGFVVENNPVRTDNAGARGKLTVRVYRTFEARIIDPVLCSTMFAISRQYSDQDLGRRALKDLQSGGRGRANSILTLPLNSVTESYLALLPEKRYRRIKIDDHELDESVLAILEDVDVPQYQTL